MSTEVPVGVAGFEDACDVIATAAALGMDVPAIPGTLAWIAVVTLDTSDGEYQANLGLFTSEEAARRAVRNWAVSQWDDCPPGDAPWEHDVDDDTWHAWEHDPDLRAQRRLDWLGMHTDGQVAAEYFGGSDDSYEVVSLRIEAAPERYS